MRVFITILLLLFSLNSFSNITEYKKNSKTLLKKLSEEKQLEFDFSFIEAVKYKIIGNYNLAIKWFYNCLKIDPESSAVRYEMSDIYIINNDYDTALSLMNIAVKYNYHNIWYKIMLSRIFQNKGMIDKACSIYDKIFEENPNRYEFILFQANLYIHVEEWEKAIKVYDRLEKIQGITELVSFEKYKLYIKLGKKSKAKKEVMNIIKEFPNKNNYIGLLAELYINSNEENKALNTFNKMLELNPNDGFVHFYLADYYKEKKDFVKSNDYTIKALKSDNVTMDFKLQYVYKLFTDNKNSNVTNTFIDKIINTLLTNYPEDPGVITLYVDYLLANNNIKEARANIYKVIKYDKYNYRLWNELLKLDNNLGDLDAQFKDASEAIKYFPEEAFPYLSKGVVYLSKGDYKSAIKLFEKGYSLTDNSYENNVIRLMFYIYLGESYYITNRIKEAFELYDKALEIDPNNVGVLNNYSYYLGLRNEQLDKAEKMISRCIEIEGSEATYLDTYAYILFKREKYSMAKFIIKKALEKNPIDPDFWEHFGDIEYKLDNKEEALKYWQKAKELNGKGIFLEKKIEIKKFVEE